MSGYIELSKTFIDHYDQWPKSSVTQVADYRAFYQAGIELIREEYKEFDAEWQGLNLGRILYWDPVVMLPEVGKLFKEVTDLAYVAAGMIARLHRKPPIAYGHQSFPGVFLLDTRDQMQAIMQAQNYIKTSYQHLMEFYHGRHKWSNYRPEDLDTLADFCYDLLRDCIRFAWAWNVDLWPIYEVVHRSNMSKLWTIGGKTVVVKDANGKVVKSPDYIPVGLSAHLKAWSQALKHMTIQGGG